MVKLTKLFTREHSLFYFRVWNDSDIKGIREWIGLKLKNNLFIREGRSNKVSVWYDLTYGGNESGIFLKKIAERYKTDKKYFEKVNKEFRKYWDELLPYLKKKKKIDSVGELQKFYSLYVEGWSTMAVIVNFPDVEGIPEEAKQEAVKIREETQRYSVGGDSLYLKFIEKYYPEYDKIKCVLLPEEIFSLKNKKLASRKVSEIKKRLNGHFMLEGRIYPIARLEKTLKQRNIQLEGAQEGGVNEIIGFPASKGKAKGRVRLVLYKEQVTQLKEGEILVTEMTSPDFVPAMKKAAAIVTDEGGITSHAAIISREMKKPCIIGTKNATKVLKDGDIVEVDADKGIVRKV